MDIQVKVDPNNYGIERGVYASWLGNSLLDATASGLISDGHAVLTTAPSSNSTGSALPSPVTYSTTLPLDNNKYSAQQTISGATAFTLASGAVAGGQYVVRLAADGTNIPTFSNDFEELTGSSGYDNTANVVNVLSVYYDGVDALYSWSQRIGDDGTVPDTTPPLFSSAVVEDASPTTLTITFNEALDQTTTLQASDFEVPNHTVSAAAFGSSTTIDLTIDQVTVAEVLTVDHTQPASAINQVKDTAGNLLASFSNQPVTNNYVNLTNVALASNGATATASSTGSSGGGSVTYPPSAAINGDRTGAGWGSSSTAGWSDATLDAFPDWLQVQFDQSYNVSRVVVVGLQDNFGSPVEPDASLTSSSYGLADFTVEYWNGSAWAVLETVTGNNNVLRQFDFTPVSTDRIRVQVTDTQDASNKSSRIISLEAYA